MTLFRLFKFELFYLFCIFTRIIKNVFFKILFFLYLCQLALLEQWIRFMVVLKLFLLQEGNDPQRRIQKPVKQLRWRFLQKCSLLNVWQCTEYASAADKRPDSFFLKNWLCSEWSVETTCSLGTAQTLRSFPGTENGNNT